jgi:hypothetical protein
MNKYTPGPWEVTDLRHSIVVRTESPNKTKYGASRYAAIGGFDRSDPDQLSEALANARLIAAAPDLLEVLKAFSDYVRDEQMATDGAVTYPTTAINHWAFLARAAIAKATVGEQ